MNIDHLKMFCHVFKEGSISQAARIGYISQPAVTRQIHQLEDFYGTLLFDRTDGKLIPTEAGRTLYPFAKSIVTDFEHSKEAINELALHSSFQFSAGASLTIGEYLLPNLLGQFKKLYPNMEISLILGNTPDMLEALTNDEIHIALVEGIVHEKDLKVEKFSEDELILVVSSSHQWKNRSEITLDELIEERMIWREKASGTRMIVEEEINKTGYLDRINSYMELGSTQSIKSAVEAGLGISFLPRLTIEKELQFGLLKEIKVDSLTIKRDLWLVQKQTRFQRSSTKSFVDFIRTLKER